MELKWEKTKYSMKEAAKQEIRIFKRKGKKRMNDIIEQSRQQKKNNTKSGKKKKLKIKILTKEKLKPQKTDF